jgi:hypothetical protein
MKTAFMKKPLLIIALLFATTCLFAQGNKHLPKISFGASKPLNNPDGTMKPVSTTLAEVLRNPKITVERGGEIIGYTVSIVPAGGQFSGPYKGTETVLSAHIKSRIKASGTKATIYIENFTVLFNDQIMEIPPFTIKYEE